MLLSDVSIRRPVFTAMMSLCLIVLGRDGRSAAWAPTSSRTSSFPVVIVTTVYKGAGPGEIETQVIKPLEDAVAGISGVDKIHSFSARERRHGGGAVQADRQPRPRGAGGARQGGRHQPTSCRSDADPPVVEPRGHRRRARSSPTRCRADLPSQELRKLIEDRSSRRWRRSRAWPRCASPAATCARSRSTSTWTRRRRRAWPRWQIAQRIGMENLNLPAGRLQLGPTELTVRTLGQFKDVDELRALPVAKSQHGRAGAAGRDRHRDRRRGRAPHHRAPQRQGRRHPRGGEAAGLQHREVSDAVKKKMAELAPALGNGFKATLLIDQSELIRENAHEVWIALIFGGAMAVLIILMFLLDLRGTFISLAGAAHLASSARSS